MLPANNLLNVFCASDAMISYGGTSLVTLLLGFGILMSFHTHKKLVTS